MTRRVRPPEAPDRAPEERNPREGRGVRSLEQSLRTAVQSKVPLAGVQRLLARMERRHKEIADEAVEAMRREIPEYHSIEDPDLLADIHAVADRNILAFIRSIMSGGPVGDEELEQMRRSAIRRANQSVPLDAVLHAYRVGQRVTWESIVREAGKQPGGRAAALSLVTAVFDYVNLVSTTIAEAYTQEQQRLLADDDRARRDLMEDILAGRLGSNDEASFRVREVGLEAGGDHLLVVAIPRSTGSFDKPVALRLLSQALAGRDAGLVAGLVVVRHEEVVALVPGTAIGALGERLRQLAATLRRTRDVVISAGISTVLHGLDEVPRGYEEALRALPRAAGNGDVVALSEIPLFEYLIANADGMAPRVVSREIRTLLEEDAKTGGALLKTLFEYLEADLHVERTAKSLIVHPNTVRYRLRRISKITGRSIRRFHDLVELLASVHVLWAAREAAERG